MSITKKTHFGKVILAGAGPGDPELMTLKTLRYLKQADVIIADRLVSLQPYQADIKEGAVILHVGKQGGNKESTSQRKINELLVAHALNHKLVLRLKGGDVSFFSNILDELKALTENSIPYEIIPGVTAASGGAAYAGIPLTARGYAASVRFITCYGEAVSRDRWSELAATDDTLVLYMSSDVLKDVVAKLLDNHIAADKELAVIEQATTPYQKVHVYNLTEFMATRGDYSFDSPTLIIIGRVASLHRRFRWLDNSVSPDNYFLPLNNLSQSKNLN